MKAILVEIEGGEVTGISTLENAPSKGVLLVDHDNLNAGSGETVDTIFASLYCPNGEIQDFNKFKNELYKRYCPHLVDEVEKEFTIDLQFLRHVEYDNINSLDLRSDIENLNHPLCVLVSRGYVGNRPDGILGDHEDDTWAIDCMEEDGQPLTSYIYTSLQEYEEDIETLNIAD